MIPHLSNIFEWFLVMFPLVFSPGPANIVAAISGARVGIWHSVPLFLGINTVYLTYSLIVGFGIGTSLILFPDAIIVMKYLGVAFILWLGIAIWFRSKTRDQRLHLGFKEGLFIQALNPKFPIILITMFSTFLATDKSVHLQIIILSLSLLLLNIVTQVTWACAGMFLETSILSGQSITYQDRIFSVLLVLVGIWIALK
jgi:threonine/homoserine/homoserine lactone efflux protein